MNDLAVDFRKNMSIETICNIYEKISRYYCSDQQNAITFAWHGGEPTLAGKHFFKKIFKEQKIFEDKKIKVKNHIQTNGTLIDDEWSDLFLRHNVSVGISIDGSQEKHDLNRFYPNKMGSYDRVVQSIKTLKSFGVRFGTLTVVDPNLNGHDVFNNHYSLGIKKMQFNLPIDSWDNLKRQDIDALSFAKFMCEVFDAWIDKDDPEVEICNLNTFIRLILGKSSVYCNTSNRCNQYLTIEPNGDVGICENFRVLYDKNIHNNGGLSCLYNTGNNINECEVKDVEICSQKIFNSYMINDQCDLCLLCKYRDICKSGCPVHRHRICSFFKNPSFFCEYYKILIEHISQRIKQEINLNYNAATLLSQMDTRR